MYMSACNLVNEASTAAYTAGTFLTIIYFPVYVT